MNTKRMEMIAKSEARRAELKRESEARFNASCPVRDIKIKDSSWVEQEIVPKWKRPMPGVGNCLRVQVNRHPGYVVV